MRSEPHIVVTCDGKKGCVSRIEVFASQENVFEWGGEPKAWVDREVEASGWIVDGDNDFCSTECQEEP